MAQTAPPEILERFKEGFEWWNCGELDLMLDHYAEDAEFDTSAVFTDTEPYSGHDSLRRRWEEMLETWEGLRMDPLEVLDAGGDRYVVDLRLWGKGKLSGAEIEQRFAAVYTTRPADQKVVRVQLFPTIEEALESASVPSSPS